MLKRAIVVRRRDGRDRRERTSMAHEREDGERTAGGEDHLQRTPEAWGRGARRSSPPCCFGKSRQRPPSGPKGRAGVSPHRGERGGWGERRQVSPFKAACRFDACARSDWGDWR